MYELAKTADYRDWFGALRDGEAKRRIDAQLNRLRAGHFGDCRRVGDGVLELRLHFGPGYRVYFMRQHRVFVMLGGGDKSTQVSDIRRAKRLAQDLMEDPPWET